MEFAQLPDGAISQADFDLLSEVQEKLEYTSVEVPSDQERQFGWIGTEEFRIWLTGHRARLG
ncbi:MAG TPA: hypothetical protein VMV22_11480 [Acidimicrobiales bacterium]|nr:hypothetical protein [Acidimicrobiales bacterium]